jgi:hypothetical protein
VDEVLLLFVPVALSGGSFRMEHPDVTFFDGFDNIIDPQDVRTSSSTQSEVYSAG